MSMQIILGQYTTCAQRGASPNAHRVGARGMATQTVVLPGIPGSPRSVSPRTAERKERGVVATSAKRVDESLNSLRHESHDRSSRSMSVFTETELRYLEGERRLARLATVGPDGMPHIAPVGWRLRQLNSGEQVIEISGMQVEKTKKFRDIVRTQRA